MTTPGQLVAKPPQSPRANLTAVERVGTTKCLSAIWRVRCTCGAEMVADAPAIKRGGTRCVECNPTPGEVMARRIVALLPASYEAIMKATGLTFQNAKFRITRMKPFQCHIGKWKRPPGSGGWQPIFVAGPGEDVPCPLERRTNADYSRKYRQRIRKAIQRAAAGGKEDPRYTRYIAKHKADETTKKTRVAPQTWMSALMQ